MAALAKYRLVFNPFTSNFDYVRRDDGSGNIVLEQVPCEADALVGHAIRMAGGIAVRAQANNSTNGNFFGIIETKYNATLCDIRVQGVSGSIYSGLTENVEYFLSDLVAGEISTTSPTASGSVIIRVGQAFSATELLVIKGIRVVRS